jgi:hypothetical protein
VPVHARQAKVQQDDVGAEDLRHLERVRAVLRHAGLVAGGAKDLRQGVARVGGLLRMI